MDKKVASKGHRRQEGILEGTPKPEYCRSLDLFTGQVLRCIYKRDGFFSLGCTACIVLQ